MSLENAILALVVGAAALYTARRLWLSLRKFAKPAQDPASCDGGCGGCSTGCPVPKELEPLSEQALPRQID